MTFSPEQQHALGQAIAALESQLIKKRDELKKLGVSRRVCDLPRYNALREEIARLDRKIEKAMDVLEGKNDD